MKKIACILAAGKGTRSYHFPFLHKALLPLNNKAVISHLIEFLSKKGVEKFVIPCQKKEDEQLISFIKNFSILIY